MCKELVVCPDIDGAYFAGGVSFEKHEHATEYAAARNNNKIIRTPIPFHCPGCVNLYFSYIEQEIIAVCDECGLKRKLLMNKEKCKTCKKIRDKEIKEGE